VAALTERLLTRGRRGRGAVHRPRQPHAERPVRPSGLSTRAGLDAVEVRAHRQGGGQGHYIRYNMR
jgi:hypothetical protein